MLRNASRLFLSSLPVVAVLFGSHVALAANSATGTASATIVAPIAITAGTALRFGNIAQTTAGSAGTLLVTAQGSTITESGVERTSAGTTGKADFAVTGDSTSTYAITCPSIASSLTGAGTTLTVDTWTCWSLNGASSTVGALSGGTDTLYVGGTLNVPAGALTTGAVSGTFDVSVQYN